jgi:drug/metabolite transporter (DMT)-like permease
VALMLGVITVSGNVCLTEALSRIDAGVTSVLLQTQVFFVAVAGWLLLGERVSLRFAIGAVIAIVGFVVMRDPFGVTTALSTTGALWGLGAALSFGLMHVVTRKYIARIQVVTVNALRLWFAVALLLVLPGRASGLLELPREAWLLAAAAAFFGPFSSRLLVMFAVRYIKASQAALIGLLVPIFAFVLEALILGVTPSTLEVVGGLIILVGVALPVTERAR